MCAIAINSEKSASNMYMSTNKKKFKKKERKIERRIERTDRKLR